MDAIQAIHTRRSIRKYTDEPIPDQVVDELLAAAMMAPSAGNAQPWRFVAVKDREKLAKVKEYSPYAAMAGNAPLAILVCGDLSLEKYPGFWVQDCSAATQNLLLAAHALGYGAVWTGVHPMADRVKGFQNAFGLPDHVVPLAFVVLGRPAQEMKSEPRFNRDKISIDHWRD